MNRNVVEVSGNPVSIVLGGLLLVAHGSRSVSSAFVVVADIMASMNISSEFVQVVRVCVVVQREAYHDSLLW